MFVGVVNRLLNHNPPNVSFQTQAGGPKNGTKALTLRGIGDDNRPDDDHPN
jgi:hypothetical protein